MTRWSTLRCRSSWRSPMRICIRTRRSSAHCPRSRPQQARRAQVLEELNADHPAPDQLLQSFRNTFGSLIQFIQSGISSTFLRRSTRSSKRRRRSCVRPRSLRWTRPGLTKKCERSVFQCDSAGTERHSGGDCRADGGVQSRHDHQHLRPRGLPGHYIQFLWLQQAPTKVRKLLGASSNAEGWAHYCEQMMLDEGYGQPGTGARRCAGRQNDPAWDSCRTRCCAMRALSSASRCTPGR